MILLIILSILLCCSVPIHIYSFIQFLKRRNEEKEQRARADISCSLEKIRKEAEEEREYLQQEKQEIENKIKTLKDTSAKLSNNIKELEQQKIDFEKNNAIIIATTKERNHQVLSNYIELLENALTKRENDFDTKISTLNSTFEKEKSSLEKELQQVEQEVSKVKAYRDNLLKAQLREKEIKDNQTYYCMQILEDDKVDIQLLEKIKPNLRHPRILSMLIWSTFFQKPMNDLCNRILKTSSTVCGIYKITNLKNNMCYIGQSVDIARRFKDHAKCGLGIDTPANNKLYRAMQEDGLWNFSWELLEKCSSDLLNEKEKYYIDFYKSKDYGYNSSIGISK